MKEETKSDWAIIGIIAAIVITIAWSLVFQPYMESTTYNKLTGAKTTWWDALWVELRVQDNPK